LCWLSVIRKRAGITIYEMIFIGGQHNIIIQYLFTKCLMCGTTTLTTAFLTQDKLNKISHTIMIYYKTHRFFPCKSHNTTRQNYSTRARRFVSVTRRTESCAYELILTRAKHSSLRHCCAYIYNNIIIGT